LLGETEEAPQIAAEAKARFEAALRDLDAAVGSSTTRPRTDAFADYARQRFTAADDVLQRPRGEPATDALRRGRAAMLNVRGEYRTLVDDRQDAIAAGRAAAARAAGTIDVVVAAAWGVLVVLLCVASVLIRRDLRRRRKATAFLRDLSLTDPLTRLHNRRSFDERLAGAVERVRSGARAFTLVLADIDRFKRINDEFGHPVGDDVLRWTADRLRDLVRDGDVAARIGGEEFGVLLAGVGPVEAPAVLERLRARFAEQPFLGRDMEAAPLLLHVTLSFGAVSVVGGDPHADAASYYARADGALYAAKRGGRNRVEIAPTGPSDGRPPRAPRPAPTGAPEAS
jgi:diguanylate cyclase (GGDEF)-like protein